MTSNHQPDENGVYPLIEPNLKEWAIYKLGQHKDAFARRLIAESKKVVERTVGESNSSIHDELSKAMYKERIRIKQEPWDVDPPDEKHFWYKVNDYLARTAIRHKLGEEHPINDLILDKILSRYAHEIIGNFSPFTYNFASSVVPLGFAQLLNTASGNFKATLKRKNHLKNKIIITGNIPHIREMAKKGTLILTPTHFSNLDSVLIGWALHICGLPAFMYGAGLNLFNSRFFGLFMNNLGAYKVDRRKKNMLYIETLKTYSRLTIEGGCHTLFFPGGTRSRSGQLETRLKLGLLGSALDAQLDLFKNRASKEGLAKGNIFVVPMVINYNFVLEASDLIENHLKIKGKERYYIEKSRFPSINKFAEFTWKFFNAPAKVVLSFGHPMDVFGNKVDMEGYSLDDRGKRIDTSSYFLSDGKLKQDFQRNREYTKMLGDAIVKQFYRYNTVLSSHLVAFTAFQLLLKIHRAKHKKLDIFDLMRLPEEDRSIDRGLYAATVEILHGKLLQMRDAGLVNLSDGLKGKVTVEHIINHGLISLGVYHTVRPLQESEDKSKIICPDMNLLYYYHNRLMGYGLENHIKLEE